MHHKTLDESVIHLATSLGQYGSHHPLSRIGTRIRELTYQLKNIAIELDEIENELYRFRRSYGYRPDIAEAYNYLCDQYTNVEADLDEISPLLQLSE